MTTALQPVGDPERPRLARFVRHPHRKPPFTLQERDVAIVRIVSQHRVITSADLQLLVGGSAQAILRRLQRLFHHGYLDRPRSQRQLGNVPMVYALGQRGAEFIAQETGQKPVADLTEKNRQLRTHYLEHALMVARFQVALRYAADSSGTVLLERWCPDGFIRDAVWVEHKDRRERIPIAPDGFFILRLLTTGEAIHGFLEADRSTMDVPRFVTKLRGYFHFWRSGRQEALLGAKHCLVVTATTSAERARNLTQACRSVADRGLRMFLFGPESGYLPATERAVFNTIWQTPADRDRHSLLE
jgi:hypothetical protein